MFNTGPYTVLPDNSILITANMQSETGFPSSHQLKSYVASKSRLKLAARAVLSANAGLLVVDRRGGLTLLTVMRSRVPVKHHIPMSVAFHTDTIYYWCDYNLTARNKIVLFTSNNSSSTQLNDVD